MNRFHGILFMVFLAFVSSALADDNKSFAVALLREGTYDIATVDGEGRYAIGWRDTTGGMYLHVEHGWDGPCCVSREYLGLAIGKKLDSGKKENIWVLTDQTNMDSLQLELKKGNSLTLEKFTRMEFDSTYEQYFLRSTPDHRKDIVVKKDSLVWSPEKYFIGNDYILYQKEDSLVVLCGLSNAICYFKTACFYRNDGSFVFDSLPNPGLAGSSGCPQGGSSVISVNLGLNEKKTLNETLFRINGVATINKSSNIVIRKNKQPKLQLKGKR
ncbi:hypothetical protein IKQ19_03700 [Candidatus Saccharibacteria bacterium]|nr:hypothetical protein [Candidatus Saccharibacteria bacterium]